MKTLLTFLSLILSNLLLAQNINFNFNGKSYQCSSFEKIEQSENDSEFIVSAFQYQLPSPEQLQDGVSYKHGLRMALSLHNVKHKIPLEENDTLFISTSNDMFYKTQQNQFKNKSESEDFKAAKQVSDQLNVNLKSKEEQLKVLAEKASKGDQNAIIELEKLINEQTNAIESAQPILDSKQLDPKFNDSQPYYEFTFFVPYKNKDLDYEVKITSGTLTITEVNRKTIVLSFKGKANMFYDEWDEKAKQEYLKKNKNTTFSEILKESGSINGFIELKY
jgi:hypothetical protein